MWPLKTFPIVLLVSCSMKVSGLMKERFLKDKTSVPRRKSKDSEGICRQDTHALEILSLVNTYSFSDGKLQFSRVLIFPYFKKNKIDLACKSVVLFFIATLKYQNLFAIYDLLIIRPNKSFSFSRSNIYTEKSPSFIQSGSFSFSKLLIKEPRVTSQ